jgi:1-acyl-sn-glycerol-3-phosphate acyltransferase
MLPPRIVRRLVFAPLVLLVTLGVLLLCPLLLLLALVTAPSRPARRRSLRLLWFCVAWLLMESAALVACLVLWIASGFGGRVGREPHQSRHYALVRWFLGTLMGFATRIFRLTVLVEEPPATPDELAARLTRPVIVLSRHAGPGDSFLLVHHLLTRYRRRPRIVMKAALQFDPSIDVVINRLPHAFVHPHRTPLPPVVPSGPAAIDARDAAQVMSTPEALAATMRRHDHTGDSGGVIAEIRRLAAGLGDDGALVIFPEGGNFTPSRRLRGIRRLEQSRRPDEARRARRLDYLLAPRSGGVFAAIDAAPAADVIFVAHTGLDDLITVRDIWRALPMEQSIRARWWRVTAAQVPRDREHLVPWLYDWWAVIDQWIAANRPERTVVESRPSVQQAEN